MKHIIFIIIAIWTIYGCSNEEAETEIQTDIVDQSGYIDGYSSDSTYKLRAYYNKAVLYKNETQLWLVNFEGPKPLVYTEYGITKTENYYIGKVYFAGLSPIIKFQAINQGCFYFYDIKGNLLAKVENTCYYSSICDDNLLVVSEGQLLTYNSIGKLSKQQSCSAFDKIFLFDFTKFISDSTLATYNKDIIYIADINKGRIVSYRAEELAKNTFPNESQTPKATIQEVSLTDIYVNVEICYTLYNGNKGKLKYIIDSNTGELRNK